MKIVGIDLDGTITPHGFYNPNLKLPWWLWIFLIPFALLFGPRKTTVKKMRLMQERGYKLLIVTSRPDQFFWLTKRLLIFHRVPFDGLFCVGFGRGANERKLGVLKKERVEIFIDSDSRIVEFMKRNSVNAVNTFEYFKEEGR